MKKRILIPVAVAANLLLAAMVILGGSGQWTSGQPVSRVTTQQAAKKPFQQELPGLLRESWAFYKGRFLVDGAHVVSSTYGGTISEGQSYALLKAVWMDDPETFRKVWHWTRRNMRRPNDQLLGWRWGEREDGAQGLIDMNNATDADQDIAYALLLAGERWQEPAYTQDALAMIRDLWRLNVQRIDGRYYLVPGTWEGFQWEYLTLDPSYFAPYVYRKFAQADKAHAAGWNQLADDIYDILEACTSLTANQLPPNWCAVKRQADGGPKIIFSDRQGEGARDFSYDAFRVYWRMAMDAALSPSPGRDRAKAYLQNHPYLRTYWQQHRLMPEGFTADGQPRTTETSGFAMGPVMVLGHAVAPAQDGELYAQMLAPHYHPDGYWFNDYNDYLHSVIWLHLYAISLPAANEAKGSP
jgi:endo-1,4-beta-D-glucanase Y